jgi:hypothetical protein
MADTDFLQQARCLHLTPEKVHDERFQEEGSFFDPKDIVQVKYELLRSCEVEGNIIRFMSPLSKVASHLLWDVQEAVHNLLSLMSLCSGI